MHIRIAPNMAESNFSEIFFPVKNTGNIPEIAVFADFHRTFSLYSVVLFLSDSHHLVGPFSTLLVSIYLTISNSTLFVINV